MSHISLDFARLASDGGAMMSTSSLASSTLANILDHRLIAEIGTALWTAGVCDFEVLRGEVDCGGHDLVLEANGIVRHIQLKTMARGSATSRVSVNLRLASKSSGCIVWTVHDPATLALGPYRWFGGLPGESLPDPGPNIARHSRANAQGLKGERRAHRVLTRGQFETLDTVQDLTDRLFGTLAPA